MITSANKINEEVKLFMRRMKFDDFYTIFIYKNTHHIGKTKSIAAQIIFGYGDLTPKKACEYFQHKPKKMSTIDSYFRDNKTNELISIEKMNERIIKLELIHKPRDGKEILSKLNDYYLDTEFKQRLADETNPITALSLLIIDIYNHYLDVEDIIDKLDLDSYPLEKLPFLEKVNIDVDDKTTIFFSFHYGMHFFIDPKEQEILRDNLLNRKAKVKIILNTVGKDSITQELVKDIRNKKIKYFTPLNTLQYWLEFMNEISEESCMNPIEIRVCKLPLMHKIHLFFKEKEGICSWGIANVSYYCYSEKNLENNHIYTYKDEQFINLIEEFKYLFDKSIPLNDYLHDLYYLINDTK